MDSAVAAEYAAVAHQIPGRVRLWIASLRDDPVRAAETERRLSELPAIEFVRANPKTGSVVIEYAPELGGSLDVLATIGETLGVVISDETASVRGEPPDHISSEEAAQRIRVLLREANARVSAAAGGLDLRLLVPGALFCLGVGVFLGSRRRRMPAWHDLIWYAFNTFQILNPAPEQREEFTNS